jgi:uncharacterized protein YjbI with pentapeptide repeats
MWATDRLNLVRTADVIRPDTHAGLLAGHADPIRASERPSDTSELAPMRPDSGRSGNPPLSATGPARRQLARTPSAMLWSLSTSVGLLQNAAQAPWVWCNLGVAGWVWSAIGVSVVGIALIALGVWVGSGTSNSRRRQLVAGLSGDAGIALVTGAVVGVVIFLAQETFEDDRFDAQETFEEDRFDRDVRRDNVLFVREVATQVDPKSKPFAGLDLREAQLAGLDISDADLSDADLTDADLTGADLSGADLSDADLSGADLSDAVLSDAVLSGAVLSGAVLSDADLTGAYLLFADLTGAYLFVADLTGAALADADLTGAYLPGADLTGADLTDADLTDVRYDETTVWPENFDPPLSS